MILYSSFNNIALLHSTLANVSTHRGREWGTMAAVVRLRRHCSGSSCIILDRRVFCVCLYVRQEYTIPHQSDFFAREQYNPLVNSTMQY
jgi:hypothetical protein